jgi:hypothetical protein
MNVKQLIVTSFLLVTTFIVSGQQASFLENLGVQIKYDKTLGFNTGATPGFFQWNIPRYGTFGLGLAYDVKTDSRWSYKL